MRGYFAYASKIRFLARSSSSLSDINANSTHVLLDKIKTIISPKKIYSGLEEHVIGQPDVKISLAVGVHNHLLRSALNPKRSEEIDKEDNHASGDIVSADIAASELREGIK
jgi:ATP-dependent protease Clp ATPase subunit